MDVQWREMGWPAGQSILWRRDQGQRMRVLRLMPATWLWAHGPICETPFLFNENPNPTLEDSTVRLYSRKYPRLFLYLFWHVLLRKSIIRWKFLRMSKSLYLSSLSISKKNNELKNEELHGLSIWKTSGTALPFANLKDKGLRKYIIEENPKEKNRSCQGEFKVQISTSSSKVRSVKDFSYIYKKKIEGSFVTSQNKRNTKKQGFWQRKKIGIGDMKDMIIDKFSLWGDHT